MTNEKVDRKIALIVSDSVNGWFKVVAMDDSGNQRIVHEGGDLARTLTYAAGVLGHSLVIPLSGPATAL